MRDGLRLEVFVKTWVLLTPVLVMLVVACGREPSVRDQNQAALQRIYNAQNTMAENARAQTTRANDLARSNADRARTEVRDRADDAYRPAKLVLAGPMILKDDDNATRDPIDKSNYGHFTVNITYGHAGSRTVGDSTSPGQGRRYFSRNMTDIGRRAMQQLRIGSDRRDRVVSIGCRPEELLAAAPAQPVNLAAESLQAPASAEGPVLKEINKGLEDGQKIRAEDIRATDRVEVVADTVIACRSYSSNLTIVARRLFLSQFVMSLAGQTSEGKTFKAFAEDLYLVGSNRITANTSCGMIWFEVVRGFTVRDDRTKNPFNQGSLNISVQGSSTDR